MVPTDFLDGDVVEASFYHASSNLRPQVCVRHWLLTRIVGAGDVDAQDFADILSQRWSDAVVQMLPTVHSYERVFVRTVAPTYSDEIESTVGVSAGSVASSALPPSLAGCLLLWSDTAPPGIMGRVYLPSACESHNSAGGDWNAAYLAATADVRALCHSLWDFTYGAALWTMTPVVWSRLEEEAYPVTSNVLRRHWSQQRRRGGFWAPMPPP